MTNTTDDLMAAPVKNTSKVKAWLSAMRLRTLPLSFSVIIMGNAVAYDPQQISSEPYLFAYEYSWTVFWLTLITTLFLQILSNLANDYGDAIKGADNEGRIGPERAIQSGQISASEMKIGIIICVLLSLISGISLLWVAFDGNINTTFILLFLVGLASIAAAIKYTVGKGAYGYMALGDVFVFIFFGIVGVCGSYFLQATSAFELMDVIFPAITLGCFCVMVLNLNNMRDRENDAAVGKRTIAVLLGFKGSKRYHYALIIIAWCGPLYLISHAFQHYYLLLLVLPLMIHIVHFIKVMKIQTPKEFDPELKKIALSSFLFAILSWIIVVIHM